MARFAKLDSNNIVIKVIYIDDDMITDIAGIKQESLGIEYLNKTFGFHPRWVQTDPNCLFRKNYAGIGFKYDSALNAFIPPKPYESWILNEETCQWESSVAKPDNINAYRWNEDSLSWIQIELPAVDPNDIDI